MRLTAGPGLALALVLATGAPHAQDRRLGMPFQGAFDQILEADVRDGLVYYRALRADRRRLDEYVTSLADVTLASASREEQIAFWLNAYNALVLKTVVDHYPIAQRTANYPDHSIRQIPGAFERTAHPLAGRALTLDQIEQTVLPGFRDPRVFLALGRGAIGSGRLRSEAYAPGNLEQQLADVAAECPSRAQCLQVDRGNNQIRISSIFSWRRKEFIDGYVNKAPDGFSRRAPVERAVLAFISPRLLNLEREFLSKNAFSVEYLPFDWSLNDLSNH